jgi:hypothetical protein
MATTATQSRAAVSRQSPVESDADTSPILLNSRSYQQATGDSIGFQSKPSQVITTTGTVKGGDISPRLQSGIAAANLIGLHIDTDMKGTAGGNVSGDVRGVEIELVSDGGSGRTIAGKASAIKLRSNIDATITGVVTCMRVPSGEAAAGQWEGLLDLDNIAAVFDDTEAGAAANKAGFIKVWINGNARFIRVYDAGN